MDFKILTDKLIFEYTKRVGESPMEKINRIKHPDISFDNFQFYKSVSSVYSSKIEGEEIDFDSYFKHKFLKVKFKPDYTQKADDLYAAYDYIEKRPMTLKHIQKAHSILSKNLLPKSQQGLIRYNPMFVINSADRIEYVAARPEIVQSEMDKLMSDVSLLQKTELNSFEVFYYASLIHFVFVKIHPFQDGNGRTGRLMEKWFLIEKTGQIATSIQLEKNYFIKLNEYYSNLRKPGLEYDVLDYSKSLDFLVMTVMGMDEMK